MESTAAKNMDFEAEKEGVSGEGYYDNEDELFDYVCAFCDNGGEILCCEGNCLRSFHPTVESGVDTFCESLGYSDDQVEAIQTFLCKNCKYQQHQCFSCGHLGSSDKSSGAEVFPCVSATCGHFYHPYCVAKLIYQDDDIRAQKIKSCIEAGYSFTCPAHKCSVCNQVEDKHISELQFAICRRCPKAYHRKCLPRNISFEPDYANGLQRRAWEGLLPNRILIYCMDHNIIDEIGTPKRDHLIFPDFHVEKKWQASGYMTSKRSKILGTLTEIVGENYKQHHGEISKLNSSRMESSKKISKSRCRTANEHLLVEKNKLRPRNDLSESGLHVQSASVKMSCSHTLKTENKPATKSAKIMMRNAGPSTDNDMQKRIERLIKDVNTSFNLEEFVEEQKKTCPIAYARYLGIDKTITKGKVELSAKAVRAALQRLEQGCSLDDAKAVCEPEVLNQIIRWKKKLSVYLAPFRQGMRYTSYGRHFTKVETLKEVVNRLCHYVQDGDMIVDFSCGSNDFSCFMKDELDKMGRKCSFKNYDLIQPKNDFNFERRDWMSVQLEDLPEGSKLIMGLNPPFGVQAYHANRFIDKAIMFRPKLIILIVPRETEGLDRKRPPYDLIWEDDVLLSGNPFYLPGSIDAHNQQMEQWNLYPPPLYLWSRNDWTAKHREIAAKHGHTWGSTGAKTGVPDYTVEENQECHGDFLNLMAYGNIDRVLDDPLPDEMRFKEVGAYIPDEQKVGLPQCPYEIDHRNKHPMWQKNTTHMGKVDAEEDPEADDMCEDMEISTP